MCSVFKLFSSILATLENIYFLFHYRNVWMPPDVLLTVFESNRSLGNDRILWKITSLVIWIYGSLKVAEKIYLPDTFNYQ